MCFMSNKSITISHELPDCQFKKKQCFSLKIYLAMKSTYIIYL